MCPTPNSHVPSLFLLPIGTCSGGMPPNRHLFFPPLPDVYILENQWKPGLIVLSLSISFYSNTLSACSLAEHFHGQPRRWRPPRSVTMPSGHTSIAERVGNWGLSRVLLLQSRFSATTLFSRHPARQPLAGSSASSVAFALDSCGGHGSGGTSVPSNPAGAPPPS